jgi:hypothetical protein
MTGESDPGDRLVLVREDLVLQGRNPDWKIGWEEGLSAEDRQEVKRAVRQGRRVTDSRLAPFAFGMAAKWRRSLWFIPVLGLLNLSFLSLQVYINCLSHHHGPFVAASCVFFVLLVVAWVVAVPAAIWHRRRRLRQAEEANRQLLLS